MPDQPTEPTRPPFRRLVVFVPLPVSAADPGPSPA